MSAMIASSIASLCIGFTVETQVVFGQHVSEKMITRNFLYLHEAVVTQQSTLSRAGCGCVPWSVGRRQKAFSEACASGSRSISAARTPMRRIPPGCCARAAHGHAAAAPPRRVMNSRLLIR
jgi:hypothetical protein